jgi:hypothetical protein
MVDGLIEAGEFGQSPVSGNGDGERVEMSMERDAAEVISP